MYASRILRSTAAINAAKQVSAKQVKVTFNTGTARYMAGLYAKKVPVVFMWAAFLGTAMFWPLGASKAVTKLHLDGYA